MEVVDRLELKVKYPDRKSLNQVLDNAKQVTITQQIEDIKQDMCDNYCNMPYKYSANEWEQKQFADDSPCNACPLNRL